MISKIRLLIQFAVLALMLGCSRNSIIPPKDMVLILKKIYMTDGVVGLPEMFKVSYKDTIAYYEPIIESYGYTTAQFDSSIKYYSKRTEEFDKIFDKVIIELSKIEEDLDSSKVKDLDLIELDEIVDSSINLWPHKTKWDMAIDHNQNPSLSFSIPVVGLGKYTLTYDAKIYPQDKSEETRLNVFFYYNNQTSTGNRSNVITHNYIKDSVYHNYSYTLVLKDSLVTHLNGWLYDHGGERKNLRRRAVFENISITYKKVVKDSLKPVQKKKHKFLKDQKMTIQTRAER